jgi:hypothetical protein
MLSQKNFDSNEWNKRLRLNFFYPHSLVFSIQSEKRSLIDLNGKKEVVRMFNVLKKNIWIGRNKLITI